MTSASRSNEPQRVYRRDYKEPDFQIPHIELAVDLDWDKPVFRTRLHVRRGLGAPPSAPLVLDGENLTLLSVSVDGRTLSKSAYRYDGRHLTIPALEETAIVEVVNEAPAPRTNKSAMGLCSAGDGEMFTQCEAEGFRKFAFAIDRPDILSTFDVVLRADRDDFPVLLSNGHKVAAGDLDDGRHWVRWQDPGPKPTYLFAIFAGQLAREGVTFETMSGRPVEVGLFAHPRYMDSCRTALDWVTRAMRWDEESFGREYDLAVFNIGVMNGFAGAMENKGLNLFDLAWVASGAGNATDEEFEYRMKSVAHEFLHHWSGDRVTVKNWFQVSLKEGLTRFRDQLFLADQTEFTSVRIKMARHMRGNQFTEDDSAVAHAPILDSYIETRNVYTNTTYDKGQEIIFMLLAMLGRARFSQVVSAYFDRYVDQAVTIEEFLNIFEEVGGLDLGQFRRWYYQGGLTTVSIGSDYDPVARTLTLSLSQSTRATAGEPVKAPHHIPLAIALLDPFGRDLPTRLAQEVEAQPAGTRVIHLREPKETFVFQDVSERPVLSRLRGFSAPVQLREEVSDEDLAFLTRHDADLFARWDAAQTYASRTITALAGDYHAGRPLRVDPAVIEALTSCLADTRVSFRARADLLTLPDERTLGEMSDPVDVDGVHAGREALSEQIARHAARPLWTACEDALRANDDDRGNDAVGRRRLLAAALEHLTRGDSAEPRRLCLDLVETSANFSNQVAALTLLAERGGPERDEALEIFRGRHHHDHLAMDRWYCAQAAAARSDTADRLDALMDDPQFDPIFSRLFALGDTFFYRNRYGLNAPGGRGYAVLAKQMVKVDKRVPMIAGWTLARCDLTRWRRFDVKRQQGMRAALSSMLNAPGASPGMVEICGAALEDDVKAA